MDFDITKPPPSPPNRTIRTPGIFSMGGETKESKERTRIYKEALERYGAALNKKAISDSSGGK